MQKIATLPRSQLRFASVGGQHVVMRHQQIERLLRARLASEEVVRLFTSPQVNATRDEVAWYTPLSGPAERLSSLPAQRQAKARDRLAGLAAPVLALAEELRATSGGRSVEAAIIAATLCYPDDDCIYVCDEQPLLVGWACEWVSAERPPVRLTRAVAGPAPSAETPPAAPPAAPRPRRSPGPLVAGVILLLAAGTGAFLLLRNRPPVGQPDRLEVAFETATDLPVVANDSDPDGDPLTATPASAPAHGTVESGRGGLRYTPAAGYSGTDRFTYRVSDGRGGEAVAEVTVTVLPRPNRPPALQPDQATVAFETATDIPVLTNDSDPDGDPLTATPASTPVHGTVESGRGGLRYTPAAGYSGTDRFTYRVSDGRGGEAVAEVTVTVLPRPNRKPVAVDDLARPATPDPTTIRVADNDSDPDGDPLRIARIDPPKFGTADILPDGRSVRYTPVAGYAGPDSFRYTVTDGRDGGEAAATVTVMVPLSTALGCTPITDPALLPEVMLVVDASGSMSNEIPKLRPPFERFVAEAPPTLRLGLTYAVNNTDQAVRHPVPLANQMAARGFVAALNANGDDYLGRGIVTAAAILAKSAAKLQSIVVYTDLDGERQGTVRYQDAAGRTQETDNICVVAAALKARMPGLTISLVPVTTTFPTTLACIAEKTGGRVIVPSAAVVYAQTLRVAARLAPPPDCPKVKAGP